MIRLLALLQFMTRLPVPARWTASVEFERLGEGSRWFPLLGLIVGTLASAVYALALHYWGPWLAAAYYMLALALITGGFHLDGLADTCDGIFSARTRERMLEIMKDSRLGTHGGLALVFLLLFRLLAVAHLGETQPAQVVWLLAAAPVAGRSLMVVLMYRQPYARENGLGHLFIGRIGTAAFWQTLLLGALLVTLIGHLSALKAFLMTLLFAYGLQRYLHRCLGGQTGDTLGAGNELFELLFLLMLC